MKKFFAAKIVLVLVLVLPAMAQDDVNSNPGPGLIKAQVLSGYEFTRFVGWFNHVRVHPDGRRERVSGEFQANSEMKFVRIVIDGVVLHDDPQDPILVLPGNAVGVVRDFWMYVVGYAGNDGAIAVSGQYEAAFLEEREPIHITLDIKMPDRVIWYQAPDGVDPGNLAIRSPEHGVIGWYNEGMEEFNLYLDADWGVTGYEIFDRSTGRVLEVGEVSPVTPEEQLDGHPVSFGYEDGIQIADLRDRWGVYLPDQQFEAVDILDGEQVPAKMIIVKRDPNHTQDTFLRVNGFVGEFQAFRYKPFGRMDAWPINGPVSGYPNDAVFSLPSGPTLIVVFYGNEDLDGEFTVDVTRGGGKG